MRGIHRYGAGEIGTQRPSKKMREGVIAVLENEAESEENRQEGK